MTTRQSEILRARSASARARAELGVDPDSPVDVFAAIRNAGLWVVFNEFDNLLGAMSREGVGGIMINSGRGRGMQRYTAAHELGHWYLHQDEVVWDTDEQMMRGSSLREVAAQEFAASFLMPRRLINHTLRRLGVERGGNIDAVKAYSLAQTLGVSYEAVLHQLRHIDAITFAQHSTLSQITPRRIKAYLTGGRLVDRNAAVWAPTLQEMEQLEVTVGDEIVVSLPENRTTGYRWNVEDAGDGLVVVGDGFVRGDETQIGAAGRRNLVFLASEEGVSEQRLLLQRKMRELSPPREQLSINATVRLTPERENARIVSDPNDRAHQ
jgi:Zn-dependent peptidase ImmA (M78 family)/predicted secreted protein